MRQRMKVTTLAMIGGLLVLLTVAIVACDDPKPKTTVEPAVPAPASTNTMSPEPTAVPTLAPTPSDATILKPNLTPSPTNSPPKCLPPRLRQSRHPLHGEGRPDHPDPSVNGYG